MHGSAPCHEPKSVSNYLKKNNNNVLPWPENSPNMNPIENLWEIVKRKVAEEVITNVGTLIAKLKKVWSGPGIVAKAI